MIFGIITSRDISSVSNFTCLTAREITYNNFEISLEGFMPNITTNHAITYTYFFIPQFKIYEIHNIHYFMYRFSCKKWTTLYFLEQLFPTCNNLICCIKTFVGGKTCNIAIHSLCSNVAKAARFLLRISPYLYALGKGLRMMLCLLACDHQEVIIIIKFC